MEAVVMEDGLAVAAAFVHFAPFTYALPLTLGQIEQRMWRRSWDIQTHFT
jgi:dolichyl-phosphate-mannose--protein O-mannosyl transferase